MVRTVGRGGLRQGDRLRHGRHLHRRLALRGRARARVRDAGRRRAHARADDVASTPSPRAAARSCIFDGQRQRVGPDSRRRNPGPACYRRGGPLTVTDCNVMLGKIQPAFFPKVFGPRGDEALDATSCARSSPRSPRDRARHRRDAQRRRRSPRASSRIAVANMANAIKFISVQRGHDVTRYTLPASAARAASTPAWWPTSSA